MKKKLQNHFAKSSLKQYGKGILLLAVIALLGFSNSYAQVAINARGENPPNEGIDKLIDSDKGTKWLDFSKTSWVVFQFEKDTVWNKYQITSGNDAPERDPRDWTIQGSTDSITWTNLDTVTMQSWSARNQTRYFSFTNTTKYIYYRWNITANGAGDIIQASEFSFSYNTDFFTPAAPTATRATNITENSVTISWNASVDSASVAYYDVYNGDTLIANTPLKTVAITGLSASTMYKFLVRATDSSGNTSSRYDSLTVTTGERSDTVKVRSIVISTMDDTTDFQVGDTLRLIAKILPENASNKNITWSVNDENGSAIINEKTGLLVATKAGRITVEAIANDELGVSSLPFVLQIKADTVKVRSITISTLSDTSNFKAGDTISFVANILPANASNTSLLWEVNPETGTATIDSTGTLIGLTAGYVTVTATSKDSLGVISNEFILQIDPQDVITSTVKIYLETALTISPNPSNGMFTIKLANTNDAVQTSVYNSRGAMVYDNILNGNNSVLVDLTSETPGLYFVSFKSNDQYITKKVILE